MSPAAPATPAERFDRLIDGLCRAIAAHGIGWPLLGLLWSRLRRTAGRFARLTARIRAGTLPAPRRTAARHSARPAPPHLPRPRLPRGFAWLVRLVPQAAAGASQLQHLLTEPELAALLAAAPQMGRILRPLCRMLGVRPPPVLRPPPPTRAPAAVAGPAAPVRTPKPTPRAPPPARLVRAPPVPA